MMLQADEIITLVDGRAARRERNIEAVLDVVIEMYSEDMLFPTIEQASQRSGLSLRSLYRYFADPGELHEAAIGRHREMTTYVAHLPGIGEGPLDQRIDDFVIMRVRLYEVAAPVFRASLHTAGTNRKVRDAVAKARTDLRQQFDLQFSPELAAMNPEVRDAAASAGDVLTQLDSLDLFRRFHRQPAEQTEATLRSALLALFAS